MQVAILTVSTLALACSAGTLFIMAKTAQKLSETEKQVKTDVETFKEKTNRNFTRIKAVLGELEF